MSEGLNEIDDSDEDTDLNDDHITRSHLLVLQLQFWDHSQKLR